MPQLGGRMGIGDTKSEMRTFRREGGRRRSSFKSGIIDVQRVVPNFQEAPASAPSKTYRVAGGLMFYFIFLKTSKKRFTCRVTWDNLCVSVCFSSLVGVFLEKILFMSTFGKLSHLKKYIKKKKDPSWYFGMPPNPIKKREKPTLISFS